MKMDLRSFRIPVIFLLLLVNLKAVSQDETANDRFVKGTESFAKGDYQQALEEWISLYTAGYRSADSNNIGNAYFKRVICRINTFLNGLI